MPMQTLPLPSSSSALRAATVAAPKAALPRSKSLPQLSTNAVPTDRAASLETLGDIASGRITRSGENEFSEDKVNAFLRKTGLDIALRGGRLYVTRHRDLEAAEAQRAPSLETLAQVCQALMLAEETPAKLDVAEALLPAVNAQLLEHVETGAAGRDLQERLKDLAKSYCAVLGGRDLAIDDMIATINTYFFDRIGADRALNRTNAAAMALTALLMLVPTIGKNLPIVTEAIREERYRDALMPALSICAISAMTLNPTMAAFGLDRASAIAAAAGNALMMANLPEIVHHGHDWVRLKQERLDPETHPFTCFARNHALVDQGVHTALDFQHEFAAQAGFLALNVKNAVEAGHSTRNPAAFPLLLVLLGSFALDTIRGEQPFAAFQTDREALAAEVAASGHDRWQAARLFIQQKIADTRRSADYDALIRPLLTQSAGSHATRQLGGKTLSDEEEKIFLKGLLSGFCPSMEAKTAAHLAIDKIYRFDRFDPAEDAGDDRQLGEILRFAQAERNKDKGLLRNDRGFVRSDNVYRNVIAHAIKCAAFEELGQLRAELELSRDPDAAGAREIARSEL